MVPGTYLAMRLKTIAPSWRLARCSKGGVPAAVIRPPGAGRPALSGTTVMITGISSEIADNSRNVLSGGGDKELGADDEAEPAPRETVVAQAQ